MNHMKNKRTCHIDKFPQKKCGSFGAMWQCSLCGALEEYQQVGQIHYHGSYLYVKATPYELLALN